jgi:hypothetical protein
MAMGNEVRVDHMQGFREFAAGMGQVKGNLEAIGTHRHLDLLPPGQSFALADVSGAMANLRGTNNAAVGRLAQYTTHADRGLSGLAFVSMYIATNFTESDAAAADQVAAVGRLGTEAQDHVPAVPETAPPVDPRFESRQETPMERAQRLAQAQPAQPAQPVRPR